MSNLAEKNSGRVESVELEASGAQQIEVDQIALGIAQSHDDLVTKIGSLVATVDAEYTFQALVTSKLFDQMQGRTEAEHGCNPALIELGAYHLYPRFGGGGTSDPGQIQAFIDTLTELDQLRRLHTAFRVNRDDKELASLQVHLRLYAEGVRGSSYPPLIRHRIEQIQGPHDTWFCAKAGIGPRRALEILDAFETILADNFVAHRARFESLRDRTIGFTKGELEEKRADLGNEFSAWMNDIPLAIPASFDQVAAKTPNLKREEWDALRELIGLTRESRLSLEQPREIKERPVYFLSGNRFILIDMSSAYDALFEAFDRLTRTHQNYADPTAENFRDKKYVPHLSAWLENEVCEYLRRQFPATAVYQQLTYPDPNRPGGETELDAAVAWGPFLILVEVKGKQFRSRSRLGDPARLRDDLRDNIEEAFDQAKRAMRYIETSSITVFAEKATGRKLTIRRDTIQRIFPISVTLHEFGFLATQLALLKRIGLFRDSAYPWSVSLADLDLITRFAGSPDVFLHYVQRRLDLQRSEKNIFGDELDVFGLYLDTRLHPSQFWERKWKDGGEIGMHILTGGSERFDEWFQAEQGTRGAKPEIRLKLPSKFSAIIDEFRRRDDDSARWMAFALLGLSEDAVSKIEASIDSLRTNARSESRIVRGTFKDGDIVVSLLAGSRFSITDLEKQTALRAGIEKYRLKAAASVALGIDTRDTTKPFVTACWLEGPWQADPILDEILAKECRTILPGQKMPGRNDLCFCGSERKFKKCCLDKVGRYGPIGTPPS